MSGDKDLNILESTADEQPQTAEELKKERIKQLSRVVCICKGISLGRVLDGLANAETVQDVNQKVGTGSGGCQGERCGPRIKLLLTKYKDHKSQT